MLLRNSPHKDSKKDSPLKSQGIIKDSPTERCCFTDVHIDKIRHCFPANAVFKSFTTTALSDSVSNTWVAFPATPFTIGYSYPFPSFTQSFFSLTGISYIQAMPMIWRVLYTFERIIEQEGIDLGMAELAEFYDLTTFGSHRYLLKRKAGEDHPVFKVTKNDTNWKRRFFFVRRDSIPDGKDLPKEWATHGRVEDPRRITITISVAHLKLTPAARERVLAFKKLDPEVRSFQVTVQDSQEVSSASATMSSAGKSAKSVKSASKFGISDLANVKSSRKKAPAASPSVSAPKVPIRGKGKKRKASDDLQGFPLLRQQFLDYFDEKFTEMETYVNQVEDQDRQIADLQQMGALKDLKIADLEKEIRTVKDEAVKALINFDYEKHDITQDAKVSAAIAMYKIQLQMATEAQDPSFDKSTWDVEGWKARLAELEDDDDAEDIPMLEGGDADKDQGGAAGGDGAAKE
ncbi:hypothetical protein HanXRQr2_Chr13g0601791 [Helianthus annuus]|uniref:Uncharacterized protein n=1 Tax=Helianthus annuus TaxID=4232 RepID=A0A9K3EJR1_HELAN|nr:hypothetical protein HanXRQr2_Chr13g0601791 [Helianthus annuus]KAJ0498714.1 hypothetical protein HanHA89_Chr13g0525901 [Helianthus annuus]KAJ0664728.1 hypothetical protein HanLR1_Chr13g0495901 [Helianthus annuus]KAJ0850359.1 hypothetical protein HanPSC8_Chr13g0579821 [Helianthus annuus]